MQAIEQALNHVRQRIDVAEKKYNRESASVNLLAVSKKQPIASIQAAVKAGQCCFGESYVQEALDKILQLSAYSIEWHFIGGIQTNKTKQIATHFDWVHSVDRLKIAQKLNDQRPIDKLPLNICVQVNINHEASKRGVAMNELAELMLGIQRMNHLRLRGLMIIPENYHEPKQHGEAFRTLARAKTTFTQNHSILLDTLSMGMSADLEYAIAEGATWVRVGTAIFGDRFDIR